MASPAQSQNNLSLVLNQQDSSGINILNRLIGAIAYAGTVGQFTDGVLTTTGATAFTLPTARITNFIFVNTHATANITINVTPEKATGSVIIGNVAPGGIVVPVWASGSTGAVSGAITAITGTSDTTGATFQMFLGG